MRTVLLLLAVGCDRATDSDTATACDGTDFVADDPNPVLACLDAPSRELEEECCYNEGEAACLSWAGSDGDGWYADTNEVAACTTAYCDGYCDATCRDDSPTDPDLLTTSLWCGC